MTATGSTVLTSRDTGPLLAPIGNASITSEPARQIHSSTSTARRAHLRRHTTSMPLQTVKPASAKENAASKSMYTSPPSTKGSAEMPARSQNVACMRSKTNAASGRLLAFTSFMSSCPVDCSHNRGIDFDREWSAFRVVDDPHVQHRRLGHVDRSQRTRRVRRHKAVFDTVL